jgi:hypothetical protein
MARNAQLAANLPQGREDRILVKAIASIKQVEGACVVCLINFVFTGLPLQNRVHNWSWCDVAQLEQSNLGNILPRLVLFIFKRYVILLPKILLHQN